MIMRKAQVAGLVLGFGLSGGGAFAATADSSSSESAEPTFVDKASVHGDDIVVTARRREELLLEVPAAITAFDQELLKSRNVASLSDLQSVAPSLTTLTTGSRDGLTVSIRGVGQGTQGSPPGVLLYLNEIPLVNDKYGNFVVPGSGLFYDLQNVQVLRGPQGTLFGRNAVGGAVLFKTQEPTNSFGGYLEGTIGNYENREFEAALNLPIIDDTLLVRVAGRGQERKGFTRSLGTGPHPDGIDLDNKENLSGRVSATFKSGDFRNDLVMNIGRSKGRGAAMFLSEVDPNGTMATFFPQYIDQLASQRARGIREMEPISGEPREDRKFFALSNSSTYEISPSLSVRNIFGYIFARSETGEESDASLLTAIDGFPIDHHIKSYTEELQLLGSVENTVDWIVGGFYLKQPTLSFDRWEYTAFFTPTIQDSNQGETSKALYAQGDWDLSSVAEGLNATTGIRHTWDSRSGTVRSLDGAAQCIAPPPGADENCGISRKGKFSAFTWNVDLNYKLNSGTFAYLATRRGYKSGGFNFINVEATQLENFDPEKLTDVEFGLKSQWSAGTVRGTTNVALYYQDYKSIQVQQLVFDGSVKTLTGNAAAARSYGAELEGTLAIGDYITLGGYVSYEDFKYTELGDGVDPVGLFLDQRPEWKYGLNGAVILPVDASIGEIGVNASWSKQATTGDTEIPGASIPSYGLLNVGANWKDIAGYPVDLSFFMTNALNKKYIHRPLNLYNILGYSLAAYGEPRMFGFRLRYKFGD